MERTLPDTLPARGAADLGTGSAGILILPPVVMLSIALPRSFQKVVVTVQFGVAREEIVRRPRLTVSCRLSFQSS
jgi:hypothetical protein